MLEQYQGALHIRRRRRDVTPVTPERCHSDWITLSMADPSPAVQSTCVVSMQRITSYI